MQHSFLIGCLMWLMMMTTAQLVQAQMNSTSFQIQFGNFNSTSGQKSSSSYTVTDTVGQTGNGQYNSTGYLVRAGFQYIYTIGDFEFTVSNTNVPLGDLTPGVFSTGTSILTISTRGAGGYQITAAEQEPLTSINGDTIPDTTCDSGTCTHLTADVWTNPTAVGFGYRMTGQDVPAAFSPANTFKQFANLAGAEPPQVIMSNTGVVKNRQSTVTYKVSVNASQAAGNYANSIVYTATPTY